MKDTDLKHLALKTAFLLAFASGKRRSEIHAWALCPVWAPNLLSGSNQRPKTVSIPTFYFLQDMTHLGHQTHYTLFLVKTNYPICYKQADQQDLDLVQVKGHDIRAFAAPKAFYGGVSVDRIIQASHWKAHNTFTYFFLKDLTLSDNDNMYLGPVVAAQQVLDPSPQTS